ncbi:MAG: hypothetical protein DRH15_15205, partial [Deltaproteobacteria bacterium]
NITQTNNNFTGSLQTYYWSVNLTDGCTWTNQTYHFTTKDIYAPTITWISPTPTNGDTQTENYVHLNTTITDQSQTSAFFDWNQSLVGYWSMDYYNSTGVFDNSTYNNFGTFGGGLGTDNITDGKYGKALEFDGSDDYIDLPKDNMTAGQSEVTLEFWINADEWVSTNTIWDEWASPDYWQFSIRENYWYTRDSSTGATGSRNNDLALPSVPTGEWHHLVFVYSVSQSIKAIYLDGELNTSTSTSIDQLTSERAGARIGYACDGTNFDGTIDEVRIYNRALSPEEIKASYNNGLYRLYHNFTGLGDGEYNYSAYVIDSAGNLNITSIRTVTVDTTPPTSNVNTITPYWQTSSPLTINATASDSLSGVKNVTLYYRFSTDNSSWDTWVSFGTDTSSPWQWSFNFPNGTGYYEFYSIATDNADNTESAPASKDAMCYYNPVTNNAPTIDLISPAPNGTTEVSLQPTCQVWANDTDGDTLTVYWYENTTGNWVLGQTNSSVTANSTVSWTYTQASNYGTTYWWKVAVNDSTDNTTAIYHFTTDYAPVISNPNPANGSTGVSLTPICNVTVSDQDGGTVTVKFYENTTGNWILQQVNNSVDVTNPANVVWNNYSNASSHGTTYWWKVNVSDGKGGYTEEIYHFTTLIVAPTVVTNDSTGVEETNATLWGYLQDDGGEACTVRFEYGTDT